MQNKIVGTDRESPLDLAVEGFNRLLEEQLICAGEIYQVIGVNDQGFEIVLSAQAKHLLAQRITKFIRRPLSRARRKNLQGVASDAVGALGGVVNSSGSGSVNANAAGSEGGASRRGPVQDVLFAGEGAGHEKQYRHRGRSQGTTPYLFEAAGPAFCAEGTSSR